MTSRLPASSPTSPVVRDSGQPYQHIQPEDLPAWMRPHVRILDRGWMLVLAFSLVLVAPLLIRPGLPQNTNAELYEYRSLEVERLLQSGNLYSRWAPDLNYEYGSPLFNYLAPLSHYLPGLHQVFTEASPSSSVKLFAALSVILAGSGMYQFVRRRWGTLAGLIAALVYLFSTPLAVTLTYQSGELALLMALGVLPWALWGLDSLGDNPRHLWIGVVFLVMLILSDTRIAGLAALLVGAAVLGWPRFSAKRLLSLAGAITLALAITAFFWLPAAGERYAIHWISSKADSLGGAIPLSESLNISLAPSQPGSAINRGMGAGAWLLALAGLLALAARRRQARDAILFAILGLVLLLLTTPAFTWLWPSPSDFQPLLPYHALLLAVFCFAVISGQCALWLDGLQARWRLVLLAAFAILVPLLALHPSDWQAAPEPDYLAGLQGELQGNHFGTFRSGVLLPAMVAQLPAPPADLLDQLQTDSFQRLNPKFHVADVQLDILEENLLYDHYIVSAGHGIDLQFHIFDYPGWNASVAGQWQPLQRADDGSIQLALTPPAGEVALWLEGTPIRYLGWFLTWAGCALLIFVNRRNALRAEPADQPAPHDSLSRGETLLLIAALLIYAALALVANLRPDLLPIR